VAKSKLGEIDLTRGTYRRIYAGFITGRRICAVSMEAEAFFWRLHSVADDFGNAPADPTLLSHLTAGRRGEITPDRVSIWVGELVRVGLIVTYDHQGDLYLHVLGWTERQPAPKNEDRRRARRYPPAPCEAGQDVGCAGVRWGEQGSSGVHHNQYQDQDKNQYNPPGARARAGVSLGAAAEVDADSTPPAVPPVPGSVPASETSRDAASPPPPPPTGAVRSKPTQPRVTPPAPAVDQTEQQVAKVLREHPHPSVAVMNPMDREVFVRIARTDGLELMQAVLDETLMANGGKGARSFGKYAMGALAGVRDRLAGSRGSRGGPAPPPPKPTLLSGPTINAY
jgi:hypothetical protein